jgi:predicted dehydrogenase
LHITIDFFRESEEWMKKEKKQVVISRRSFLGSAGLAAGAVVFPQVIPGEVLGLDGAVAPSERIVMGCIGVGPRGNAVMHGFLPHKDAQVVAVCDLKKWVREGVQRTVNEYYGNSDCAAYEDYRELLQREDIDAVTVATTDHWHNTVAIAAARSGKDIYMEKPMGTSFTQAQLLRKVIRETGRVFQFGTQQRSDTRFCLASELALNDKMGTLKTINVWSPPSEPGGDPTLAPAPDGLDYDRWLGPAPYHPHTVDRTSNAHWWFISDYALGFIAGWGIHPIDIAVWGGGDRVLKGTVEVEGKGVFPATGTHDTAVDWDATLRYSSGITLEFKGRLPKEWQDRYPGAQTHGTAFEGTDGWVHVNRGIVNAQPEGILHSDLGPSDKQLFQSPGHARNTLDCIKSRKDPVSSIDAAVQGEALCHISDIAIRLGRKLTWDLEKELFIGDAEANARLTRKMREPYTVL